MRSGHVLAGSLAFASRAMADIYFSAPVGGDTYAAGAAITVTMVDNGENPSVADLSSYDLSICYGGDTTGTYECTTLATDSTFASLTTTITVDADIGGSTNNAYFLKAVSTVTAGGTVTDFSDRFSLSGMTGTFSTEVTTGLADISGDGDSGPVGINTFTQSAASATSGGATGSFAIPYNLQTGLIKYAPMQPIPPTKITAKVPTPLYPTSSYSIATTYLGAPTITLTVTESQTFSVQSYANTIAAQVPRVTNSAGEWIKRWID